MASLKLSKETEEKINHLVKKEGLSSISLTWHQKIKVLIFLAEKTEKESEQENSNKLILKEN